MQFIEFAKMHGLIIDRLEEGRWCRVPTVDKPGHKNGAYRLMGSVGFVQNWATMTEPSVWRADGVDLAEQRALVKKAAFDMAMAHRKAAEKARWILSQCELSTHEYITGKGFADEQVNVWEKDEAVLAVIPMRIDGEIVGCQLISADGSKKFLTGQRTAGAMFSMGKGMNVLCEGYATGLSVRAALRAMKIPAAVHVCFSAGNMAKIAKTLRAGLVVADNDASRTGEATAQAIGWPYWMSDTVGEDFNDTHQRVGLFAVSQQLAKVIREARVAA